MCGIFATTSAAEPVNPDAVGAALAALHHRGPDGRAMWLSPDKRAALGHTRLAIIGVENGVQPIANEDGLIQIVVNGEFYDFEKIRADLQAKGHVFTTESDSEIAIHLYEEYGVGCLDYLRGEFAFVIWDGRLNRLFAARDRFGIKPLVYAHSQGRLILASEAKALFAYGVPAIWDSESFFHSANFQYVLPDRTLFKGVKQLPPGHFMIDRNGELFTTSYWDLDYPVEDDGFVSSGARRGAGDAYEEPQLSASEETAFIERFGEEFDQAVRLRLRADAPVCCHLSGGLDSSAVLGVATRFASKPIKCFTVSFEEESYDELAISLEMARFAGADLHSIKVSHSDLVKYLSDAVYFSEGFAVNGHLAAKYLLNKEIRRNGYKVALTGEGSDEVVAGYPHLRSDLYQASGKEHLLAALHASNKASAGIMLKHGDSLPLDAVSQRLGYVPSFLEAKGTLGFKICAVLSDDYKKQFSDRDGYGELIDSFDIDGQLQGRHRVNQSLYLWSKTALSNYILRTLGDGMEMSHSVEGRLPFLDHHLFEFVRTLPMSMKIRESIEKFVLREAVKPVITKTIYERRKHPFVAPPVSAFAGAATFDLINDILRSRSFTAIQYFDKKKLFDLLERLPSMKQSERAACDPVLMTALSAASLQSRFNLREV